MNQSPAILEKGNYSRRRFLRNIALTLAVTEAAMINSSAAQSDSPQPARTTKPEPKASFAPLKQIDAGVLSVGYAEAGPVDGPAVILLHGWPYDIHSYVEVAPLLAAAGYRVIVPYLRGYGTTRFLSAETVRNGQQSVFAVDTIALLDALGIEQGDRRRLRLGSAHGQHLGSALAGALQGTGVRQRLSDRQPGSRPGTVAAES